MTAPSDNPALSPGFELSFDDLQTRSGLQQLDRRFLDWLSDTSPELHTRLLQARASAPADPLEHSLLLIALARTLDRFIPELFNIEAAAQDLREAHDAVGPVLRAKYKFVKRQALLTIEPGQRGNIDPASHRARLRELDADPYDESRFAGQVLAWTAALKSTDEIEKTRARDALGIAREYAAWAAGTEAGQCAGAIPMGAAD